MTLGGIIRAARKAKGITAAKLAATVGFDRSYFSQLERGVRRLDDEAIVLVALALDLNPTELLLVSMRERLPENLRQYLPPHELISGLAGRSPDTDRVIAREYLSQSFEFEVERSTHDWKCDWEGNLQSEQTVEGCRPCAGEKPVFEISFKQWTIGSETSSVPEPTFEVVKAPKNLEFSKESIREGNSLHRIIRFPKGWRRKAQVSHDSFSFKLRNYSPGAFFLDADRFLKEAEKAGIRAPNKGVVNAHVRRLVKRLDMTIELPRGYEPESWKPWVWWGSGPLVTSARNVGKLACRSLKFRSEGNRATLTVDEPTPGYTFSITWSPLDNHSYLEARYGRER